MGYVALSAWAAYSRAGDAHRVDVHPSVERAVRLLRAEDAPETLGALADQVGLSPSRLSHLFRRQTGVRWRSSATPSAWSGSCACGRGHRRSVTEAALEAGFGSYPQFHRVFTRRMGCSPAAYRRRGTGFQ